MESVLWIFFLLLTAVGAALAALFLWQGRFSKLAEEHAALAEARRALEEEQTWFEDGRPFIRKRPQQAFLCLGEVRVEQRRSFRSEGNGRYLILHERITFRNIALSNWLEQEVAMEPSDDVDELAQAVSIFASGILSARLEPTKPYIDTLQPPTYAADRTSAPVGVT